MGLELTGLQAGYDGAAVLRGIDMTAPPGQITCIMGRNGAGKSTLMKTIIGLVPASSGRIALEGRDLTGLPAHRIAAAGIAWVPQGRRLFAPLTVAENLAVGGILHRRRADLRDRVLRLFPRLAERLDQRAGTLSGGEQQMLAIGRALCLDPKVILLDEPTEGLQPSIVAQIRAAILTLRDSGVAVLLVEQRKEAALALADQVIFMVQGRVADTLPRAALTPDAPAFGLHVGL